MSASPPSERFEAYAMFTIEAGGWHTGGLTPAACLQRSA